MGGLPRGAVAARARSADRGVADRPGQDSAHTAGHGRNLGRIPHSRRLRLCEGQQLKQSEYPELYKAIGSTYNNAYDCNGRKLSTTSGYFRLPDLRGRFVVGYNVSDADYGSYGKVGGEKRHTLTVDEIPSHAHGQNLWTGGNGSWRSGGSNSYPEAVSWHDRTTPFGTTDRTGGGGSHENRPPYYTLAYVMRTK